jgi:hypothetical protein
MAMVWYWIPGSRAALAPRNDSYNSNVAVTGT